MKISTDDFRRHFELLSDEALLATNRDDLTAVAQTCYDDEVVRRGLHTADPAEDEDEAEVAGEAAEEPEEEVDPASGERMVVIATYTVGDEAGMARGLLLSAEIPAQIASTVSAMVSSDLRLMVPESFVEQALEILDFELSDEELAAQAEAAGEFGDEDPAVEDGEEEAEQDGGEESGEESEKDGEDERG